MPPAVDVTDYIVEPKTIPIVFDSIGFAESSHLVEIRARVEGYLDQIAYQEGALVHEGDLLFQLDPTQFKTKVEDAKGAVAKQEAAVENAKLTVNRLTPLYQQKAASKKDLDNAIAQQLSSEASLQSAKAQLLDAEINLGYTTIRSPITGISDKSKYRQGALITPGSQGLLTTISMMDPIWVYFTISDNELLRITKQSAKKEIILPENDNFDVEAILADGSPFPHKGKVSFSAPTYDQSTGTLLVRAVFPNPIVEKQPEGTILPGQFIRIKVSGAQRPNAIIIPRRALMQKKDGMFVYLIKKDGTIIAQDVSGDEWYGDYQIITNGLKTGDAIVVDGINKIRPGMAVHVISHWKPIDKTSASTPPG